MAIQVGSEREGSVAKTVKKPKLVTPKIVTKRNIPLNTSKVDGPRIKPVVKPKLYSVPKATIAPRINVPINTTNVDGPRMIQRDVVNPNLKLGELQTGLKITHTKPKEFVPFTYKTEERNVQTRSLQDVYDDMGNVQKKMVMQTVYDEYGYPKKETVQTGELVAKKIFTDGEDKPDKYLAEYFVKTRLLDPKMSKEERRNVLRNMSEKQKKTAWSWLVANGYFTNDNMPDDLKADREKYAGADYYSNQSDVAKKAQAQERASRGVEGANLSVKQGFTPSAIEEAKNAVPVSNETNLQNRLEGMVEKNPPKSGYLQGGRVDLSQYIGKDGKPGSYTPLPTTALGKAAFGVQSGLSMGLNQQNLSDAQKLEIMKMQGSPVNRQVTLRDGATRNVTESPITPYNVGNFAGQVIPAVAGEGILSGALKLGAKQLVKRGLVAGAVGSGMQGVQSSVEGKNAQQIATDMAVAFGLNAVADIGLNKLIGAIGKKYANETMTPELEKVIQNETEQAIRQYKTISLKNPTMKDTSNSVDEFASAFNNANSLQNVRSRVSEGIENLAEIKQARKQAFESNAKVKVGEFTVMPNGDIYKGGQFIKKSAKISNEVQTPTIQGNQMGNPLQRRIEAPVIPKKTKIGTIDRFGTFPTKQVKAPSVTSKPKLGTLEGKLKTGRTNPEKVYYRGTNPNETKRISTGNESWDNNLFVSTSEKNAKLYGNKIEKVIPKSNANILVEGSKEFNKIFGKPKKNQYMLEYYGNGVKKSKELGYDIVEFKNQSDVGTVVINENSVVRNFETRPSTLVRKPVVAKPIIKPDPQQKPLVRKPLQPKPLTYPKGERTNVNQPTLSEAYALRKNQPPVIAPKPLKPSGGVETPTIGKNATTAKVDAVTETPDIVKKLVDDSEGATLKSNETIKEIAPKIKDAKFGASYAMTDVYRNFKHAFGENFETVKKDILDPFDKSKGDYVREQKVHTDDLYNNVVKKLGIKKGSKESAAVQDFGEGNLSLADLKVKFPDKWNNIVEADKWFRKSYDDLIDKVNESVKAIYPTNADKLVPKRKDYYRHFKEMIGISGLKNLFDSPSQIDPNLVGVSDFTQPGTKWASFKQKRGLGEYKSDAVGGFLDYIPSASYSIHIDPHINKFRGLAKDIAESTAESKNANNFIEYLRDYSNDLAGKTNPIDRPFQKLTNRKTYTFINAMNNRVKKNTVMMNVGSSISQFANLPLGIAKVKNPIHVSKGMADSLAGAVGGKAQRELFDSSDFLSERYSGNMYNKFDTKILEQPEKFASWMLGATDELGTKAIWSAVYRKAKAQGVGNPIKHADDVTRSLVAGRGVGEVPLAQKSKTFQVIAPFQLEVANQWHVMKDMVNEKDFGAVALLLLGNYIFNNATEEVTGKRVTFDPVRAIEQAVFEDKDANLFDRISGAMSGNAQKIDTKTSALQKAGRLGGEVLSNIPLGSTIASQLSEKTRTEYLGKEDPTRFGSGLLVTKGLQDPLYKLLFPFGGGQAKKTLEGTTAFAKGGSFNKDKLRFPIKQTTPNAVKTALFGQYSTPEAVKYFNNATSLLSGQQTAEYAERVKNGEKPEDVYNEILQGRKQLPINFNPSDSVKKELDSLSKKPSYKNKDLQTPGNLNYDFSVNKKKYTLTDEQGKEYADLVNKYATARYEKIVSNTTYKGYEYDQKVTILNKALSGAIEQAKMEMLKKIKP